MTDTDLKPCPFCGGEAEIRERMDENIWDHSQVVWQSVSCGNIDCDLQGYDWPKEAEPNAVERWNTRADPSPVVKPLSFEEAVSIVEDTEVAEMTEEGDRRWTRRMAEAIMNRVNGGLLAPVTPQQAAEVLLENIPNPIFDSLKGTMIGEFKEFVECGDDDGYEVTVSWTTTKRIIHTALKAIKGEGK